MRPFKKSDVAFMYASHSDIYRAYGATLVVWGHRISPQHLAELHDLGIHYQSHMWLLTAGADTLHRRPDLCDATVVDFRGERIVVPWLRHHVHDGTPNWWGCTNHPAFREHSREEVRRAMKNGPDGLQIDDHTGTAQSVVEGGCFCSFCMDGFRQYLGKGPDFDYRAIVGQCVSTREEYVAKRLSLPLRDEFHTFQVKQIVAFINELRELGERTAGHPITLSVNAVLEWPWHLADSVYTNFQGGETQFMPKGDVRYEGPIFSFKMADAIGRPLYATAFGANWADIKRTRRFGLVKTWIAQTYAFGHCFMAPTRAWCYTEETGGDFLECPGDVFSPLYRFIGQHADLLDGYVPAAQVALVSSDLSVRHGKVSAPWFCRRLAAASIPFEMLLAGDDWIGGSLSADSLARHSILLVTDDSELSSEQKRLIDDWAVGHRVVTLSSGADPVAGIDPWVRLSNLRAVQAVLRVRSDDQLSFVVHLLNKDYDNDNDRVNRQSDGRLFISNAFLSGRRPTSCTAYSPRSPSKPVAWSQSEAGINVELPELDFWTILRFDS